jgi:hypothetical protein
VVRTLAGRQLAGASFTCREAGKRSVTLAIGRVPGRHGSVAVRVTVRTRSGALSAAQTQRLRLVL